jgi:hypothetical protein
MNARDEFIEEVAGKTVLCAAIHTECTDFRCPKKNIECGHTEIIATLNVGYSAEDYTAFLELLNFEYDDGFGLQNIFGCIWYTDGTWSGREQYDGSEWWDYMEVPAIPESLIPANKREGER